MPRSRSIARLPRPRPPIPKPTRPNSAIQANDQLRAPEPRRAAGGHAAAGGRSYCACAARLRASLLRYGGNRRRRAVGGFHRIAEGLHGDARRRRNMIVRRRRRALRLLFGVLARVADHLPVSLSLALSASG